MGLRPTNEDPCLRGVLERPASVLPRTMKRLRRPRAVPAPDGGPTFTGRNARLEVHLTVPPATDAGATCRALVHALARLAVSRALAEGAAEEEPDAGRGLCALFNDAPGR